MSRAEPDGWGGFLLLQPRWLGDVLLCTPAIRALRASFPAERIDFFAERGGAQVLEEAPHLDEVLSTGPTLRERWALHREVARRRYRGVVDFRSTRSTALLALISRAPVRVGVRSNPLTDRAYTHVRPRDRGPTYEARQKLELLVPLGIEPDTVADLSLDIAVGAAERAWADGALERLGLADGPVVAISAVARDPQKRWAPERWAVVADSLVEAGARVLLTHGPGEERQAAEVAALMRFPRVVGPSDTTPRKLAAVYQRAVLWVGHDGGPKHIASAAGVPTLSVMRAGMGPRWSDTASPVGHRFVEGPALPGNPRGGLDALPAREVAAAARAALLEVLHRGSRPSATS